MVLTSKENIKALSNLNDRVLAIMNDRGIIASYLILPLSKVTNPELTSQFTPVRDPSLNRVNDF